MPIYAYKCSECGNEFDEMTSISDGGVRRLEDPCPECGKVALKKKITAPQLHMRLSPAHPRYMRGQRQR